MEKTVEVTLPSARAICVTRTFAAPAQRVFECHTKPEYVRRWLLGPPGWSMPVCEIDLRIGGTYRYVWREEKGNAEFGVQGEYREIDAPARIVHVETMDGVEGKALCTLEFTETPEGTVLRTTMAFDSQAQRDRALESGMTDGMSTSYDRLGSILERDP